MADRLHRLDDLDSRIVRELVSPTSLPSDVRVTYARIARKLGVDEETVRRRLKKVREKGVVVGWKMLVNPGLLGCTAAIVRLETHESRLKARLLPQLALMDGVVIVVDFRGPVTLVQLHSPTPDELQRRVERMATIARSPLPVVWPESAASVGMTMRATDWRIVAELIEDARRDLSDVADRLGVTRRTVERRLAMMRAAHAVHLAGQPNLDAIAGVVCDLIVGYESHEQKQQGDHWLLSEVSGVAFVNTALERGTILTFIRENLAESEKVLERARAGIAAESVELETIRSLTVITRWQAEKVRALADAGPGGRTRSTASIRAPT